MRAITLTLIAPTRAAIVEEDVGASRSIRNKRVLQQRRTRSVLICLISSPTCHIAPRLQRRLEPFVAQQRQGGQGGHDPLLKVL
jgi:hypothetical protein